MATPVCALPCVVAAEMQATGFLPRQAILDRGGKPAITCTKEAAVWCRARVQAHLNEGDLDRAQIFLLAAGMIESELGISLAPDPPFSLGS